MIRIGELTFEGNVNFGNKELSIVVPLATSDSDILAIKNEMLLEIIDGNNEVVGSYRLVGWKKEEKLWNGIMITWQTVSTDEVDTLKGQVQELQGDLAELSSAVQDIADAIESGDIGGAKEILDILLGEGSEAGDGE